MKARYRLFHSSPACFVQFRLQESEVNSFEKGGTSGTGNRVCLQRMEVPNSGVSAEFRSIVFENNI